MFIEMVWIIPVAFSLVTLALILSCFTSNN